MIDFIIHLDQYLVLLIQNYGLWIYLIVFLVIFCETGLVVTPILPGDSLLFLLGALSAQGLLDLPLILSLSWIAAFLGDMVNYHIGKMIGAKAFASESRIFKKEYLTRTQNFYEKHGNKTIIFARFMPIVRTFAPFVAGVGRMPYRNFMIYNALGGAIWVLLFVVAGYFFGNVPLVKENLTILILGIIAVSIVPGLIEYLRNRSKNR